MTAIRLTRSALREGTWRAELRLDGDGAPPRVELRHLGRPLEGLELERTGEGCFEIRVPIPPELLSDGVQSLVLTETESGDRLGALTLIAGAAAEEDLRAEIDLIRAELDMLKHAFRRHCVETM